LIYKKGELDNMDISFLGGAREVGASCILLTIYNKNILLDCGIRQSSSKDSLPDFKLIQDKGGVDAIVISHAHMDHIGSLPIISREYPEARIYTTRMTKDLMRVLLYDSLKIMNHREGEIPLYAEKDVISMLNRVFPINYMVKFSIFDNIVLTFYMAGHIAGASCVYITTPEGSFFYSGDFSLFSQKTVEGLKLPKLRPDAAIFESTYGDRLHSNRQVEEEKLVDIIDECISEKGKMLIPAFALGRAQEVILIIKKAINKKMLKNVKVYVDGMIRDINRTYKLNPLYLKNSLGKKILKGIEPFYDDNIIAVKDNETRKNILESEEPCVIISSSGMLTGGYSQYYAEKIAALEKGYIVITGYQDEESPGRKLLDLLKNEENKKLCINEKTIEVKCKVEKIGLSAHSDKFEIKSLIHLLNPRSIFIVHGDEKVVEGFSRELFSEVTGEIYAPKCGESYEIYVHRPRKQRERYIGKIMNSYEELDEGNVRNLWGFVSSNYEKKLFTLEELFYIWRGRNKLGNSFEHFQKIIIDSPYFESDSKRLFLFGCQEEEKIRKILDKKELKPNELREIVYEHFGKFNFKKASYIYDEKKIILSFDFPAVVDKDIYDVIKKFQEKLGWKVEISNKVNINAVSEVVKKFLRQEDISKISYRLEKNEVLVILASTPDIKESRSREFKNITGMDILIRSTMNSASNSKGTDGIVVKTDNAYNVMEQNKALQFIDDFFYNQEFSPYRKSVKSFLDKKYIELSFISPIIGKKYKESIKKIADSIGWDISVSGSANQNEIIKMAVELCKKEGIEFRKNPAFNALDLSVELKIKDSCLKSMEEKLKLIKTEFGYKTGCVLKW
jgi:predicted metal-dependent RNase